MQLESIKYLLDIKHAISDIEIFFNGVDSFKDYSANKLLKAATERKLLIIGEAVNKFRVLENNMIIVNADKIYGLRNRLAHAYDSVDDNIIYTIVIKHLPNLKTEIQKLIDENHPA